jgi:hypothetical protein
MLVNNAIGAPRWPAAPKWDDISPSTFGAFDAMRPTLQMAASGAWSTRLGAVLASVNRALRGG